MVAPYKNKRQQNNKEEIVGETGGKQSQVVDEDINIGDSYWILASSLSKKKKKKKKINSENFTM